MQVVLFHVPPKTEKQVAQLLRPYGISVRTVSREQYTTPLGVLLGKGFGWAFIINILLTLLGYIPGLIHAFWVQTRD